MIRVKLPELLLDRLFSYYLLLGVADVAGKYYLSSALGGFVIYVVLIVVSVLAQSPGLD